MANYKELSAQIATLMQKAEAARKAERSAALAEIRAAMVEYGISASDLGPTGSRGKRAGGHGRVPPKFRHPRTGETWSGRGLRPRWLAAELEQGQSLESFIIA